VIHFKENDYALNFVKAQGCYKCLDAMERGVKENNTATPWTFKIYELDVVPKDWRCKHIESIRNLTIPSGSLYGTYTTRYEMVNKHITIILKNGEYYVHPGTGRYLINCVVDDFNISALIIDHDHNYDKIVQDFPSIKSVDSEIDYTLHRSGDAFTLKLNSGWNNEAELMNLVFESANFYELAVPNASHSVRIIIDNEEVVSYDNEKPQVDVFVDDICGWAKFLIDYYCERKLTYNGYKTDL